METISISSNLLIEKGTGSGPYAFSQWNEKYVSGISEHGSQKTS